MILIDTCILSSLGKIDKLDLLDILFRKHHCYITQSIFKELYTNKIAGFSFVDKIELMISFKDEKNKVCILSPEPIELEEAYGLREKYKLSLTDCEFIVVGKSRNAILLSDDGYLCKIASREGLREIFDLKSLIEANIIEGKIKSRIEVEEIIGSLKQKDYYIFSDKDLKDIFENLQL